MLARYLECLDVLEIPGSFSERPPKSGMAGLLGAPEMVISTRKTPQRTHFGSYADTTRYSYGDSKLQLVSSDNICTIQKFENRNREADIVVDSSPAWI